MTRLLGVVERSGGTRGGYDGLSVGVAEGAMSSLPPLSLGCLHGWMVLSFEKRNHRRGEVTQFLIYSIGNVSETSKWRCQVEFGLQRNLVISFSTCLQLIFFWIFPSQTFKHFQDFSSLQSKTVKNP